MSGTADLASRRSALPAWQAGGVLFGHYALVSPGRFRHLTDPATYSDDVRVRVSTDRSEAWVSEQLFDRLMELGRAYRLHVMTLLADSPRHEPAWINGQQAEALVEEVEFLRDLAAPDTALTEIVAALLSLIVEAARYGDRNALVVEGP